MKPLCFRIQCLSVLLVGVLLSTSTACSPNGDASYGTDSDRNLAASQRVQEIQTEETLNWLLEHVFGPRCLDRNVLTQKTLSDLENRVCDAVQRGTEDVAQFKAEYAAAFKANLNAAKQEYPIMTKAISGVLHGLGGVVALIKAQQARLGIAGLGVGSVLAIEGGGTIGGLGLGALLAAAAVPTAIVLAALVSIVYLADRAVAAYPIAVELVELLVDFYRDRDGITSSELLQVANLQARIIEKFKVALGAAGLGVIPFAAGIVTLTQRAVTAYNTTPLVLSHTLPATVIEARTRMHSYLAAQNIVKYSPVIAGHTAVFQQLLASSSSATDAAPVFRANVENVIAQLATYGVTVSRSLQSATIHLVNGLGAQAGYEGVYEITLPTTCEVSGCAASPVTLWIPATNALLAAQAPVVVANVLLANTDGQPQEVTVTSADDTASNDPTTEVNTTGNADIAAGLEDIAEAIRQAGERQAAATESAGNTVADAIYEQARQLGRIADELHTSNQPPPKDLCNKVGTILATAAPFVVGAIAYGRLNAEDCSTCRERLDGAVVATGAVAVTALVLRRRLFNLLQSGGAKTIGRLANRIVNKTWTCGANPFEGYDLAVSGITAGASTLATSYLWSWFSAQGSGADWTRNLCEGPLECVNPEEESDETDGAQEGAEDGPLVEYTTCSDETRCEDKCMGACTGALSTSYGDTAAAICGVACGEFKDVQAGTKNANSLCAAQDTTAQVCGGALSTEDAWISVLSARGWVSCSGGASIAPSVNDCP